MRTVLKHQGEYPPQWEAMNSIAGKIGCTAETPCVWVRRLERDQGLRGATARVTREWVDQTNSLLETAGVTPRAECEAA